MGFRNASRVRLLGLIGLAGMMALIALAVLLRQPKPAAQTLLKLPDGSSVRIMAVTYGTNHLAGSPVARMAARMPAWAQVVLQRVLGNRAVVAGSTTTTEPTLVVWIERLTNSAPRLPNAGFFDVFLADGSGFVSGADVYMSGWSNPEPLRFGVFPRRDRAISVNFYYHSPTGGVSQCGSLPFANPLFGSFPQWQPETLPVNKQTARVAASVSKLSTGHDQTTSHRGLEQGGSVIEFGTNRLDGRNSSVCFIQLHSLTDTNETWCVVNERVSDATGNKIGNSSMGWGSYEDGYFTFEPGLWTNESAWKLGCELKRVKGFQPGETFVFKDVPLGLIGTTNRYGWTKNLGGVTVTLDHLVRRAPKTNETWSSRDLSPAKFFVAGLTKGWHLDLISAVTQDGTRLETPSWESTETERTYYFRRIPEEAKTVDLTFAVQHSEWVEFVVKPEVGLAQKRLEH